MKKLFAILLAVLMLATFVPTLAEGIGSADAPIEISIQMKDVDPADPENQAIMAAVEAGMAAQGNYVKIKLLEAPAGKYIDVTPLAFRTGEINPDIIWFQGNTDAGCVSEGLLEDLTPYVENSTYVKAIMGEHSKARMASSPYLLWLAPAKYSAPVIRKDFLAAAPSAEAFLSDPTPEAYKTLLKEIMDNVESVKYGVTVDGGLSRLDSIFNHAFGVTSTIVKQDGAYVYAIATEANKNKLAYYAELYAAGVLDIDYITKQWDTMEQAFYDGECALIAGTAGDVIQLYNAKMVETNGEGAELVALPPAKGVSFAYASIDVTKEERGFAINAESSQEVKDACFAIFEYMASPEGRELDKLGVKDKHYTVGDDGTITFTEAWPSYWARFFSTTSGLPAELKLASPVLSVPAQASLDLGVEYYANDINVIIPSELSPQYAAIQSIYTEYANEIVRGVRPVEDFAEMVQKINDAGMPALSEYFASVLDK